MKQDKCNKAVLIYLWKWIKKNKIKKRNKYEQKYRKQCVKQSICKNMEKVLRNHKSKNTGKHSGKISELVVLVGPLFVSSEKSPAVEKSCRYRGPTNFPIITRLAYSYLPPSLRDISG